MKKNKRLFSIISISLSFLIVLSGCSTFVKTVHVSKPIKLPGSEKVIKKEFFVKKESNPSQQKPILVVKCSTKEKIEYSTYREEKRKYEKTADLVWISYLGYLTLTGGGLALAAMTGNCSILLLDALYLGYMLLFVEVPPDIIFYKTKRINAPNAFEIKTSPLSYSEVVVKSNNIQAKNLTNPQGLLSINLFDFKYPITEYRNYEFGFFKDKQKFENNISLNSKLWIQTAPPYLEISNPNFYDSNGNNRIDANENSNIAFNIANKGKGYAYNLKAKITETNNIQGLSFKDKEIGSLAVDDSKDVTIPIHSNLNLDTGTANFRILVTEENNFDTDPFTISVATLEFQEPEVIISDYQFLSEFDKMILGVPITLKTYIQNIGQGLAEDISIDFILSQENVFSSGETKFTINKLKLGETREINFEFFGNKRFNETQIDILADITEKYGKYGQYKKLSVEIDQPIEKIITITGEEFEEEDITISSMTSDVDKNIPQTSMYNPDAFAVVIGNRDYEFYPDNPVEFALNDRNLVERYAQKVFGYKKVIGGDNLGFAQFRNIFGTEDNKKGELYRSMRGKEPLIIYITGHGHSKPQLNKKAKSYIVPKDGNSYDLDATCYPMDVLYQNLSYLIEKKKPENLILIMDMCFSGYLTTAISSARWESDNPLQDLIDIGKSVGTDVICIFATQETQTAKWYQSKKHGLLTYFVLKAFHNSENEGGYKADYNNDKKLTVGELKRFVLDENYGVPYFANQREVVGDSDLGQLPVIIGDDETILLEYK